MTTIKNKILHIVEKNNIRMIPRWQFVLYSVLGILGLFFSFLALVFIASIVVFVLSRYGFMYLPLFGFGATMHLLSSIPIQLGITAIILVFITEILARQYAFAFKKPLIITLLVITGASLIIGFLISLTPMHHTLRNYARMHHMGMMEHMYDRPAPFRDMKGMTVIRGTVIATSTKEVRIRLFDDTEVTVYATTSQEFMVLPNYGSEVVVFGNTVDGSFVATIIKVLPGGMRDFKRGELGTQKRMMEHFPENEINGLPLQ